MAIAIKVHDARLRLARHYVQLVSDAYQLFAHGGENSFHAVDLIQSEQAQVKLWFEWLSDPKHQTAATTALLLTLLADGQWIFVTWWSYDAIITHYTHGLALAQATENQQAQITFLHRLALVYNKTGEIGNARETLQQANALAEAQNHTRAIIRGLVYGIDVLKPDPDSLVMACQKIIELSQATGDYWGMAQAYLHLAWLATRKGEWDKAKQFQQDCQRFAIQLGDYSTIANLYRNMSIVAMSLGHIDEAAQYTAQTIDLFTRLNDHTSVANSMMNMGMTYDNRGEFATAQHYYLQALAIVRQLGITHFEALIFGNLGFSAYLQGNYADCVAYSEQSIAILRQIGQEVEASMTFANIIPAYLHLEQYDQAREALLEGLGLALKVERELAQTAMLVASIQTWVASAKVQTAPEQRQAFAVVATQWAGFILSYPNAEQENRDEVEKLRPTMEALLGVEGFQQALQDGQGLDLRQTLTEIVAVLNTAT